MNRGELGSTQRNSYRLGDDVVDMSRPSPLPRKVTLLAQPQTIAIDLNRTAVIIVDMQNDFCAPGGWFDSLGVDLSGVHAIYQSIKLVANSARKAGMPVIWLGFGIRADRANLAPITRYPFNRVGNGVGLGDAVLGRGRSFPHNVLQEGSWGSEVVPELGAQSDDIHVSKHRLSGFLDSPLDSILRNLDIKTIAFMGVNSDQCVFSTLMDANFHGYDTILIEDGCATSSPQSCHESALYQVRFCLGFTVGAKDWSSAIVPRVDAAD